MKFKTFWKIWLVYIKDELVPVADPGFSPGGAPTPKIAIIFHIFAENCMKMKEFGPPGGGRASLAPPLGSANGFPQKGNGKKINMCITQDGGRLTGLSVSFFT